MVVIIYFYGPFSMAMLDNQRVNDGCEEPGSCVRDVRELHAKRHGKVSKIVDFRDATNKLRLKLSKIRVIGQIEKTT